MQLWVSLKIIFNRRCHFLYFPSSFAGIGMLITLRTQRFLLATKCPDTAWGARARGGAAHGSDRGACKQNRRAADKAHGDGAHHVAIDIVGWLLHSSIEHNFMTWCFDFCTCLLHPFFQLRMWGPLSFQRPSTTWMLGNLRNSVTPHTKKSYVINVTVLRH